jgi:DnaJ-domain-containing protein 1
MARLSPDLILRAFAHPGGAVRGCHYPDCGEEGLYRAPVSRDRLRDYYWFCLEHVRDYNRAWDFFKGMSEAEIETQRRRDTVWQRPSWPLGGPFRSGANGHHLDDAFGLFADGIDPGVSGHRASGRGASRRHSEQDRALAVLDLAPPLDFTRIKARYKQLAKQLHPDANGGDKQAEERLKVVNQAYSILKSSFAE